MIEGPRRGLYSIKSGKKKYLKKSKFGVTTKEALQSGHTSWLQVLPQDIIIRNIYRPNVMNQLEKERIVNDLIMDGVFWGWAIRKRLMRIDIVLLKKLSMYMRPYGSMRRACDQWLGPLPLLDIFNDADMHAKLDKAGWDIAVYKATACSAPVSPFLKHVVAQAKKAKVEENIKMATAWNNLWRFVAENLGSSPFSLTEDDRYDGRWFI